MIENGKYEKDYPAREGWQIIPLGNRVIAHNKWGGAREVIETKPLSEKKTKFPTSWRYKK